MIQLSNITNAISNIAHTTVTHAKNLYVTSRVDSLFHMAMGTIEAHPYIALLGVGVAVYFCNTRITGLVENVKKAASYLYAQAAKKMTSLTSLLRQSMASRSSQENTGNPPSTKKEEKKDAGTDILTNEKEHTASSSTADSSLVA